MALSCPLMRNSALNAANKLANRACGVVNQLDLAGGPQPSFAVAAATLPIMCPKDNELHNKEDKL